MAEPTANLLVVEKVRKEFGGLTAVNDLDFTTNARPDDILFHSLKRLSLSCS